MGCVLLGCSKEEQAPLPPLEKIKLPETVAGMYKGTFPCSGCKNRVLSVNLAEDSSLTVIQTLVGESMKVDTLRGKYSVSAETVFVELSQGEKWNLKRDVVGNLALLNGAGSVYEDENGLKAMLIRVHNASSKLKKENN